MSADKQASSAGPLPPPVDSERKATPLQVAQMSSVGTAPHPCKIIPAEFVDTPRLQHSAMATASAPPTSSFKQHPISATLPATVSLSYYSGTTSYVTTRVEELKAPLLEGGLSPRPAIYQYAASPPPANRVTSQTGLSDAASIRASPESQGPQSHVPVAEITCTPQVTNLYSSCPLDLQGGNSIGYRLVDPVVEPTTTVTRYRLPRVVMPKLLPMKEVEYCTEAHQGRHLSRPHPSFTHYIIPSHGKAPKRRNAGMSRGRGLCQDWVLPCLETLIAALSRACNCNVDLPQLEIPPAGGGFMYAPDSGDAICLRCGQTVDSRMLGMPGPRTASQKLPAAANSEPEREGRIPLPVFAYSSSLEQFQPARGRDSSGATSRAPEGGKRRSAALGYPTDDQGLVALPAFALSENK
ncbi:hypothetical protein Efla_005418 [Eimeria flavescens]